MTPSGELFAHLQGLGPDSVVGKQVRGIGQDLHAAPRWAVGMISITRRTRATFAILADRERPIVPVARRVDSLACPQWPPRAL